MNFAQAAKNTTDKFTENGMNAYSRLDSNVLSLFGVIGALRNRSVEDITEMFTNSFRENPELTTKMLFYAGNVRGGLGERRTFRICLKTLANIAPRYVENNIKLIPHFNRWDSLFVLTGTKCEKVMWNLIKETFKEDLVNCAKGNSVSLLGKWMPSENASSPETIHLARRAMGELGMTGRTYRKALSELRHAIRIVERDMSANNWDEIIYDNVPSYAMKNYSNAFRRHDEDRFNEYVAGLKTGESKVNSSVLYPYDLKERSDRISASDMQARDLLQAQWDGLPNYVEGENNYIVMADVSGSMSGRPMAMSTSLAVYFAERNKGYFHNLYMTFTDNPHFITLKENDDIYQKLAKAEGTDFGYNTDLNKAFDLVLRTGVDHKISNDEMPKAIIVISDMEIDWISQRDHINDNFVEIQRKKFARYGYNLPKLVLWNVDARNNTFLGNSPDLIHVSGGSPSSFKELTAALDGKTGWDVMIETLNNPMYDCIWIGKA